MKRFGILVLAMVMALGSVSLASAVELKAKGGLDFAFIWFDNPDFADTEIDGASEDDFHVRQRARLYFDYVANENLKGQVAFEIGESVWGEPNAGADWGADDKVVQVKRAYLQFTAPGTGLEFTVGVQGFGIASYVAGNPVFDDEDAAGVAASYSFSEQIALTAMWVRLYDDGVTDNSLGKDEVDAFGVVLPVELDGVSITPYALYALAGEDTGFGDTGKLVGDAGAIDENVGVFWFGGGVELNLLDPFVFAVDGAFGSSDAGDDSADREGYYLAAKLGYKMDMVYPQLIGWWASGEDDDDANGSEAMPVLAPYLYTSTFGFDNSAILSGGDVISDNAGGTAGLALIFAGFTFMEDLTHDLILAYAVGTHDENPAYFPDAGYQTLLTEEDSAWEVNCNTQYQVYENLAAVLELGMVSVDMDKTDDEETAWKAAFGLEYKF